MGKQQYGRKSGFKRGKSHKNNATSRGAAKKQRTKNEIYSKPAQDTSDEEEVSEELSTVVSEVEVERVEDTVYKEPSEYDNLLRKLGSGNESVANAYRRRLREEEGRSDTDDGSDSGSEEPDDDGDDDDEDDDDEGFKRGKSHKNNATSRGAAKKQRTKNEIYSKPAQDTSDEEEVSEELSTVVSEGEVERVEDTVYKEPSEYDNLLRKLGSGNESVANAYRRRLREEEGRSDTDDGSDSGSEEPDDDGDDDDEDDDDEG